LHCALKIIVILVCSITLAQAGASAIQELDAAQVRLFAGQSFL